MMENGSGLRNGGLSEGIHAAVRARIPYFIDRISHVPI